MKRVECEKCLNSEFVENDKLRCRMKSCQPDYADMKECREDLLRAFPKSFVNDNEEFIADAKFNKYFLLKDCQWPEDIDCKVLEWLSRSASYDIPYSLGWRNDLYHIRMANAINSYLGTNFSVRDFEIIYENLGNSVQHEKTLEFLRSGYDFTVFETVIIN